MWQFEPLMGTWWREDMPETKLSGILNKTSTGDGIFDWVLLLDGDFDEVERGFDKTVTLYGETVEGPMTLQRAIQVTYRVASPFRSQFVTPPTLPERVMSRWEAPWLIKRAHCPASQVYEAASFRVPHAIDWLGPSFHNRYARPTPLPIESDDALDDRERATLENGILLRAGVDKSGTSGILGRTGSHKWQGHYSLERDPGFTLDEALDAAEVIAELQSLAFGTQMSYFDLRLRIPGTSTRFAPLEFVQARTPEGQAWRGLSPFFDSSEVDFEQLVRRWQHLIKAAPMAQTTVLTKKYERTPGEIKLLAQCSALEALAQHYWQHTQPSLTSDDQQILEILRASGVKAKSRKAIEHQLLQRRWPLATKLLTAAEIVGKHTGKRLLGDINDWAYLVMRLRNAITHGLVLPAGLSQNDEFAYEVQRSVEVLLKLVLMKQVGFSNMRGSAQGELVWDSLDGNLVASHPRADLLRSVEAVSERSGQWPRWRAYLEGRSQS